MGPIADNAAYVDFAAKLKTTLRDSEALRQVMAHWDLNSLDLTSCGKANRFAAPGGLSAQDLLAVAEMLPQTTAPVALTVASFDPSGSSGDGRGIADIAVRSIGRFMQGMLDGQHMEARQVA